MKGHNFWKLLVLFSTLNLVGCITTQMYRPHYAYEQLSSVLISVDGEHLVAITDKHDYVFDHASRLIAIIKSDLRSYVSASFDDFEVATDGATSGTVVLTLRGFPPERVQEAASNGFAPDRWNRLSLRIPLRGTMYKGSKTPLGARYALNQAYTVRIKQDPSAIATTGKILATPVTAAADGVLVLSGAALILVASPFVKQM
ncbi:hypothetical protein [Rhodanobacter aciditrophus]|uniref:hypothetical protein n=1 Tax=Rhodanobacter aciditrophus TaxID=1623218 RepID=UPI003CF2FDCD